MALWMVEPQQYHANPLVAFMWRWSHQVVLDPVVGMLPRLFGWWSLNNAMPNLLQLFSFELGLFGWWILDNAIPASCSFYVEMEF